MHAELIEHSHGDEANRNGLKVLESLVVQVKSVGLNNADEYILIYVKDDGAFCSSSNLTPPEQLSLLLHVLKGMRSLPAETN